MFIWIWKEVQRTSNVVNKPETEFNDDFMIDLVIFHSMKK